jgi:hypothetical protein
MSDHHSDPAAGQAPLGGNQLYSVPLRSSERLKALNFFDIPIGRFVLGICAVGGFLLTVVSLVTEPSRKVEDDQRKVAVDPSAAELRTTLQNFEKNLQLLGVQVKNVQDWQLKQGEAKLAERPLPNSSQASSPTSLQAKVRQSTPTAIDKKGVYQSRTRSPQPPDINVAEASNLVEVPALYVLPVPHLMPENTDAYTRMAHDRTMAEFQINNALADHARYVARSTRGRWGPPAD